MSSASNPKNDNSSSSKQPAEAHQTLRLPLFWLSLAFLGGIPLAASLSAPWWVWALVAFLLLAFAFVKERFPRKFQFLIPPRWGKLADYAGISLVWLMLALSLGALRYQLSLPNPADPQRISSVRDDGEVYVVRGYLVTSSIKGCMLTCPMPR